ncbi:MAG: isoleucine--tRNA ligase [Planctomycetaceae bacterium]|jgi:isoleucyl-tRNA synthetase|nr:isoleucine--tRNA ligase [Planctomycetaceae bacterium]
MSEAEVSNSLFLSEQEQAVRNFWNENKIYEKTLENRKDAPRFVFYEGPPTANGMPHPGHCLTRAIKDLYPRYKTMRGFLCERKAGWDTHGLPVEVEVCKELGIHSKEDIENYGVEPFIHRCIESVFRYVDVWEELTQRIGFWVNLDEAYVTFHKSYVESVWWALKQFFERGLLYQGHKIVWWWAQGGTALSSGEVGQGYREVADPSVTVRFPLKDALPNGEWTLFNEELAFATNSKLGFTGVIDLLVWTTTPWTLPSNQFAAVHPDLDYALVRWANEDGTVDDRLSVLAKELVPTVETKVKKKAEVLETYKGSQLVGLHYIPPFDFYSRAEGAGANWRIVSAGFVSLDAGTGIVHVAPAFGEDDYNVLLEQQAKTSGSEKPELICCVAPDGKFTDVAGPYSGIWVKDADKTITKDLKSKSLLLHQEQYLHEYPFCWRSENDPLIQYPRKSWFIKTSQFKDKMLANNAEINWLPEHIKNGRFGNFLESNVDWALSRERFWGTPLPIWVCEETGKMEAIGSYEELLAKSDVQGTDVWEKAKGANPELSDDLIVHKPYIDAITYKSPFADNARMKRVPEVIDCWFDSGAMPFAQWGFPHKEHSITQFRKHFPADFISEAIDQTRGWFYSQLAISTLLFDDWKMVSDLQANRLKYPHPFKNCIVLGLMLGEDGQKMSKSKRNYREPTEIFDKYGADALRWYFYANQTPWTAIRYSEAAIKDSLPEFIIRLQNVVSFYGVYSKIDGFNPLELVRQDVFEADSGQLSPFVLASANKSAKPYRPVKDRAELDRWILSELNKTNKTVADYMDKYDHYTACGELIAFVDSLSNWYVRRSRDRFWSAVTEDNQTKYDAYWTLYECLIILTKLIAPFVPFLAETIWQKLAAGLVPSDGASTIVNSVHLCDYPQADENLINEKQSKEIKLYREIVSLGRSARVGAKLKVRQPLSGIKVMFSNDEVRSIFAGSETADNLKIVQDELNVKEVQILEDRNEFDRYVSFSVLPDFKKLGKKLGKDLPAVKKLLAETNAAALLAELDANKKIVLQIGEPPIISAVELLPDEIQVRLQAKDGWAAAQGSSCVVVLSTELTDELLAEGRAREVVRLIQDRRKAMNCNYTDRIVVGIETQSAKLGNALRHHFEYIKGETLATDIKKKAVADNGTAEDIDGEELTLSVAVVLDC